MDRQSGLSPFNQIPSLLWGVLAFSLSCFLLLFIKFRLKIMETGVLEILLSLLAGPAPGFIVVKNLFSVTTRLEDFLICRTFRFLIRSGCNFGHPLKLSSGHSMQRMS